MNKHTPGPWKVGGKSKMQIFHEKHNDLPIATVHLGAGTRTNQTYNALLIAAAPEMFALLEMLATDLEYNVGNRKTMISLVKGVIAKAKGECGPDLSARA